MTCDASDLQKILDTVEAAYRHHQRKDEMNSETHLARETRYSPLTSSLGAAVDRLQRMIEESKSPEGVR